MNEKMENNEKIDIALQDITVIRETLEDTKVHYGGMYRMCFLMAVFNIVKYTWLLLEIRFMPRVMIGMYAICYLWPLLLVIGFLHIYREEKKYSNKYYLSMIGIWGFMAGVVPAVTALVNVFGLFAANGRIRDVAGGMRSSDYMERISGMLLLSILLVICGYILQRRLFMGLAVLNLFCFMLLETCLPSGGIPFPAGGQTQTKLAYCSVYTIAVTCLGYLALGFYLLHVQKRKNRTER